MSFRHFRFSIFASAAYLLRYRRGATTCRPRHDSAAAPRCRCQRAAERQRRQMLRADPMVFHARLCFTRYAASDRREVFQRRLPAIIVQWFHAMLLLSDAF